jgi:hypothetical protein
MDKRFQNSETMRVALWLKRANVPYPNNDADDFARAAEARDYVLELMDGPGIAALEVGKTALLVEMLRGALARVNWFEVADYIFED